jgi:thioredoxin 1
MSQTDGSAPHWWAICLCAEWCHVCREWREAFTEAAAAYPQVRFAWVDVEDEAEAMGDVDIETFPTVLIARDDEPFFLGPIQPSASQLNRLMASLMDNPDAARSVAPQARDLLRRLHADVLPN